MEDLYWPPMVTRQTWPQFWFALSGQASGKISANNFQDLQVHIDKYLAEQTPEGQLKKAQESLEYELTWWPHE